MQVDRDRQALRASLYDRQSSRGKSFSSVSAVRFGKLHLYPKEVERNFDRRPDFVNLIGALVRARSHCSNVFFQPLPFSACFSPENAYLKIFHFFQIRKFYEKRAVFPNSFLFGHTVHPSSPREHLTEHEPSHRL